jgi:hypothetical protein
VLRIEDVSDLDSFSAHSTSYPFIEYLIEDPSCATNHVEQTALCSHPPDLIKDQWIFDTGASAHMTPNKIFFQPIDKLQDKFELQIILLFPSLVLGLFS